MNQMERVGLLCVGAALGCYFHKEITEGLTKAKNFATEFFNGLELDSSPGPIYRPSLKPITPPPVQLPEVALPPPTAAMS